MSRLQREIEELKALDYEQLMDKRNYVAAERIKLESKLNKADSDIKKGLVVDEDWYSRCNYAFMRTGTLITSIDNEVGVRKRKERVVFSDVFMSVAQDTLPKDLFDSLYQQAQTLHRNKKINE